MEIKTSGKVRVRKYTGSYNDSKDGTRREVDLELGLSYEECSKTFGEPLAEAVFAGYVEDETSTDASGWKLKNPKPSKRVVFGNHRVVIDGVGFVVQPKLFGFRTVDDAEKVIAIIRLELGEAQKQLRTYLEARIGHEITVTIEPSDMELPLGEKTTNLSDRKMAVVKGEAQA